MAEQKMQAPQGMAGLVRYFDEEKSVVRLKPEHVIALCAGIVIFEVLLYTMV